MVGAQPTQADEQRVRALLESARVGIILCDPTGEILFINEFADHLLGRRPDDDRSADWLRTTHPDDVAPVVANLQSACQCGDSRTLRHRLIDNDGRLRWVDHGVAPFRDADGERIGCLSTFTDVSAEHAALVELEASRNFTDAVLDTVGALVVVVDPDGQVLLFNNTCEKVTGFAAEQVIGRSMLETLVPIEQRGDVTGVVSDLASSGGNTFENDWMTADGGRRRISWTNTTLTDQDGHVTAVIGTGIDVTDQRLLESRLAQADRLDAIGRLTAGIAHDFNNTLATLQLRIDRISERQLGADTRTDIDGMTRAIERTQNLISELSSFGRRQLLNPTTLDVNDEIRQAVRLLTGFLGGDIMVELDLVGSDASVLVDRTHFEQIITNLVFNAKDAMPTGGKLRFASAIETIRPDAVASTRVPTQLGEGSYVVMRVSDTGVGISPDDLDRVFDPYFTTKPPGRGTGLGLATTYGTIAQSGGAIIVDSELDHGTTFSVWLPHRTLDPTVQSGDRQPEDTNR